MIWQLCLIFPFLMYFRRCLKNVLFYLIHNLILIGYPHLPSLLNECFSLSYPDWSPGHILQPQSLHHTDCSSFRWRSRMSTRSSSSMRIFWKRSRVSHVRETRFMENILIVEIKNEVHHIGSTSVDEWSVVDVVYTFRCVQKTFDEVPQRRLLVKVRACGVAGQVSNWMRNCLSVRKRRMAVSGWMSGWEGVWYLCDQYWDDYY